MSPYAVLVGPPGAGKTTVGRALATLVGQDLRDTDDDVVATTGSAIADLFVDHGEAWFREQEAAAVATALAEHDGVLALGGGAVTHPATRAALRGHPVVFLDVGAGTAAARVGFNTARPLLLGNVRSQLRTLMDERRPLYVEVAAVEVVTDGRTPEQVAVEVAERLAAAPQQHPEEQA